MLTFFRYSVLFFLCTSVHPVFCQNYFYLIRSADSAYRFKNFSFCEKFYEEAFAIKKSRKEDLYKAACCFAENHHPDKAFQYLHLAFENGWINSDELISNPELISLHADKRWKKLTGKMQKEFDRHLSGLNFPLRDELLKMKELDQQYRIEAVETRRKYGSNAPEVEAVWQKQIAVDSANVARLEQIFQQFGWTGKSLVGENASNAAWLILKHAPLEIEEKYFPLLEEAANKGEANWNEAAYLKDRMLMLNDKPQIYGTQFYLDYETQRWEIYQIDDSPNVDKRRDEKGMEPLEEYIKKSLRYLSSSR